jgi:hypothetical protein
MANGKGTRARLYPVILSRFLSEDVGFLPGHVQTVDASLVLHCRTKYLSRRMLAAQAPGGYAANDP